jgi:hypothetical protein
LLQVSFPRPGWLIEKNNLFNRQVFKSFRSSLRNNSTSAEAELWELLKSTTPAATSIYYTLTIIALRPEAVSKVHFSLFNNVHFFLFVQKETNQRKRAPEKTTSSCLSARYTGLKGATKQAEVRAFSGLPSRR